MIGARFAGEHTLTEMAPGAKLLVFELETGLVSKSDRTFDFMKVRKLAVDAALHGRMKAEFEQGFFDQFTKRLRRYGKGEKAARAALACVGARDPASVAREDVEEAIARAGVKSADAIEDTLLTLVEDGFLHVDASAGTAAFAYRLVANWWRTRPGDRRRKKA